MGDSVEFPLSPINPLHRMMMVAYLIAAVNERFHEGAPDPLTAADGYERPADSEFIPVLKLRQVNAVQRTVNALRRDGFDILYVDEIFWTPTGIDIIAVGPSDGTVVFAESKATSKRFSNSPLSYLRSTRNKKRQMSWDWIIDSVEELHLSGPSAPVFFRLLRPLAEGRVERRLYVWQAEDTRGELVGEVQGRLWSESDLRSHPAFDTPFPRGFGDLLCEIDAKDPMGGLAFWSRGIAK